MSTVLRGAEPTTIAILVGSVYVTYHLALLFYRSRSRPLSRMPGPKRVSWLYGSVPAKDATDEVALFLEESWLREYGPTFKVFSNLGAQLLYTVDTLALKHILSRGDIYYKSEVLRYYLGRMLGKGLLIVDGEEHKQQRRVMNPAFGPMQVHRFTGLFVEKSNEMTDAWLKLCSQTTRQDGKLRLDAFAWLNKTTLDIIGLAGFHYDFDSLNAPDEHPNVLNEAPTARHSGTAKAQETIRTIGMKLITEKKAAILASHATAGDAVKRKDFEGYDLLTLLIKSNMASDLPESARMTDDEILAQVPTFIVAGHETTSTAVAWALFAMSCFRDVQNKLRAELRTLSTDTPTEAELTSLTYLDHVVREILRLHPPVYGTSRVAERDDVIPLREPYTDIDGVVHHEIHVRKGDFINIPIMPVHRRAEIWGDDAHDPERWENIPDAVKDIPTVWGNLMTFVAGQHSCIGYRFAIIEMKALLFSIVRSFEFELGVSPADIVSKTMVVTRPTIASHTSAGAQLPLVIWPVKA
ncbi:cytochrome P450 [Vararia minispora EC-137]|uniref:Cytochrome P450 n=1 Tax=Vararia minispora EC-137 TaxID=1314806 RepID=A0ACB8QZF8_9AGAM|nr:cytochrome P450 [Vararia minispora EC-137]